MTDSVVAPAEARSFLADFASDPAALTSMPDADVVAYHGRVTAGVAKHAKPVDWLAAADADTKGYVQNKQFKDPMDVLTGYRNLEKLRGVPADRLITLPEKSDDAAAMRTVFERLGLPKAASEYRFDKVDALAPEFGKKAAEWFHKIGVPAKMANELVATLNEDVKATKAAQDAALGTELAGEQEALKKEWGANYDKNFTVAKGAVQALGWSKETIDAIESVLGYNGVFKLLYDAGQKFGEDKFISGNSQQQGTKTIEEVRAELAFMKADKEAMRKATDSSQPGHAEAKKRLQSLIQAANPDGV